MKIRHMILKKKIQYKDGQFNDNNHKIKKYGKIFEINKFIELFGSSVTYVIYI